MYYIWSLSLDENNVEASTLIIQSKWFQPEAVSEPMRESAQTKYSDLSTLHYIIIHIGDKDLVSLLLGMTYEFLNWPSALVATLPPSLVCALP